MGDSIIGLDEVEYECYYCLFAGWGRPRMIDGFDACDKCYATWHSFNPKQRRQEVNDRMNWELKGNVDESI